MWKENGLDFAYKNTGVCALQNKTQIVRCKQELPTKIVDVFLRRKNMPENNLKKWVSAKPR